MQSGIFGKIFLIAILLGVALDGTAQKSNTFNSSGSSFLLVGDMQVGGHYIFSPLGFGVNGDFSYVLKSKLFMEGSLGYFVENHNNIDISRFSIHFGSKYQLFKLKNFSGYGGAGINIYVRNFKNLTSEKRPTTTLWGSSFFTEISIEILPKLNLATRAEQVFMFNEKVQTSEGSKATYSIINFSIGLRKTL